MGTSKEQVSLQIKEQKKALLNAAKNTVGVRKVTEGKRSFFDWEPIEESQLKNARTNSIIDHAGYAPLQHARERAFSKILASIEDLFENRDRVKDISTTSRDAKTFDYHASFARLVVDWMLGEVSEAKELEKRIKAIVRAAWENGTPINTNTTWWMHILSDVKGAIEEERRKEKYMNKKRARGDSNP